MNAIKYALLGLYGVIGMLISTFGLFRVPFAESLAREHYRYALGGVLIILLILPLVIGVFILSFNANNYKSDIVQYVKEHSQRDLVLQGDIKVTFFPKLGLDTGKMTLSQRNSAREFASVNNARLYIAWMPLLHFKLVFDHVEIDGARINLTRYKDGTANYDDLLIRDKNLAPATFDIDNLRITNSSLNWLDEMKWQRVALQDLQIETGRLADAVPSSLKAKFHLSSEVAHSDSDIALQSRLFYDRKEGRYELAGMEGTLQGTAAGFSNLDLKFNGDVDAHPTQDLLTVENIAVSGTGNYGQRSIETRLGISRLQFSKGISGGNNLTLDTMMSQFDETWTTNAQMAAFEFANRIFKSAQLDAGFDFKSNAGSLRGKLSSPVSADFGTSRKLSLSAIVLDITAKHPILAGELPATATGSLQADLGGRNANLSFIAKIDDSKITGTMAVRDFSHPAYMVDLNINRLPLDRYISAEWVKRYQEDVTRIDLSGIRDMNLHASLHAGEVRTARFEAGKLAADINIEQSSLTIEPLSASLYGGSLSGSISVAAQGTPQISVKLKMKGIQADALLAGTSAAGKLTGKGDMAMDLSAEGSSIGAMRKSLSGNVLLSLTKGSLAGIDLHAALIEGKDDLGSSHSAQIHENKFGESTGFSGLKAEFIFKDGDSRGNSFSMKSSQFQISGEGDVAMESGNIDYRLAAKVSPALNRRNAGDLAELKGVTVPLRASGPFAAPVIALDFAAASGDIVTRKIAATAAAEQASAKEAVHAANEKTATAVSSPKRAAPAKKTLPKSNKIKTGRKNTKQDDDPVK
jgi:AsmA protein